VTILALSTSTPHGSVAVVEDDRVLAEAAHDDPRGHAEHLFALVDDVLARAGRSRADLRLVACDLGPGSFTGVRIAVASAKGIAVGLGLPLAGVVSLEAMAAQARAEMAGAGRPDGERLLVAVAIDAKKEELYVAVYGGEEVLLAPSHLPIADVAARVAEATAGAAFVSIADAPAFVDFAVPKGGGAPPPGLVGRLVAPPSAVWVARLAAARCARRTKKARGAPYEEGAPPRDSAYPSSMHGSSTLPSEEAGEDRLLDPADVVPLYVRAPDAVPANSGTAGPFAMLPTR
jgi:tRNA threonylcarbamoyladenosine biosynthesis protein TsaB